MRWFRGAIKNKNRAQDKNGVHNTVGLEKITWVHRRVIPQRSLDPQEWKVSDAQKYRTTGGVSVAQKYCHNCICIPSLFSRCPRLCMKGGHHIYAFAPRIRTGTPLFGDECVPEIRTWQARRGARVLAAIKLQGILNISGS